MVTQGNELFEIYGSVRVDMQQLQRDLGQARGLVEAHEKRRGRPRGGQRIGGPMELEPEGKRLETDFWKFERELRGLRTLIWRGGYLFVARVAVSEIQKLHQAYRSWLQEGAKYSDALATSLGKIDLAASRARAAAAMGYAEGAGMEALAKQRELESRDQGATAAWAKLKGQIFASEEARLAKRIAEMTWWDKLQLQLWSPTAWEKKQRKEAGIPESLIPGLPDLVKPLEKRFEELMKVSPEAAFPRIKGGTMWATEIPGMRGGGLPLAQSQLDEIIQLLRDGNMKWTEIRDRLGLPAGTIVPQ